MVWNHRVVHRVYDNGEESFGIYEAYYPEVGAKPDSITQEPVSAIGDTLDELREDLQRMIKALDQPVLEHSDF